MVIAERADRFRVSWDERHGWARLELIGFWSLEDTQAFMIPAAKAVDRSRQRHGRAFVLIDFSSGEVAAGELIGAFTAQRPDFLRVEDRVALVFRSALLRSQMKRVQAVELEVGYFDTVPAAEAWLAE